MYYEVKLTTQAIEQIEEITNYILKTFSDSKAAWNWANTVQHQIKQLDFMPARYPLIDEEPWCTRGIHKMPIKNFLVYYIIDEIKKVVWIIATIYERRDQLAILSNLTFDEIN